MPAASGELGRARERMRNSWAVEIQIYNVSLPEARVRVLQRGLRWQPRTRLTAAALRRGEELWGFRPLRQGAMFSLAPNMGGRAEACPGLMAGEAALHSNWDNTPERVLGSSARPSHSRPTMAGGIYSANLWKCAVVGLD